MKRNSRWSSLVGTFSGLLVLGSLLGASVSGCEEQPPINRVQTMAVDKGLFTGSWYMTQTFVLPFCLTKYSTPWRICG